MRLDVSLLPNRRFPRGARLPRVAILGAGFGGLCAAIRLQQAGLTEFTIYEKSDGVGGTWRDNSYPGAGCDVPSHLYSFSFASERNWTRKFARQPEILDYIERITDRYGLRRHLRCNTTVTRLDWSDDDRTWTLTFADGTTAVADVVISGLGQLNRPAFPDIAGRETFAGTTFHSARWDHDHDLTGERVAVIGSGASAVQFIPEVQRQAGELVVFQRSPNWIMPRNDRAFTDAERRRFATVPGWQRLYRSFIYWTFETRFFALQEGSKAGPIAAKITKDYLRKEVADPELRAKLTPDYPVGCKRILISDDFYRALTQPNVEVVTDRIDRIEADAVVTADGRRREVDTIIYGTGFRSTEFLAPLEVHGRGGVDLHEVWRDGAEAYEGITVSGFPNLFVLYGPNTNLGHNSIIFMLECQVHYVMALLHRMVADGLAAVDVRPEVQASYNAEIQASVKRLVWASDQCSSWYKTDSGKVTNNWPHYTIQYWARTRTPNLDAYEAVA